METDKGSEHAPTPLPPPWGRQPARFDRKLFTYFDTCWEQFLAMSFAQLTYRESLRDIEPRQSAVTGR